MPVEPDSQADWQRTWHDLWEILGCKWTFHIIRVLSMNQDGYGFNEIGGEIKGITSTMLSRRLNQLEQEGVIAKSIEATSPPTSNYRLTETGEALADILLEIEQLNPSRE